MLAVIPAVAVALAVSISVPTTAMPRPMSADFFGMHAISIPPAKIPGVASVRLWDTDTTWRVLNPRRGVFHWRTLDERVAAAEESGTSVLLVLGATPEWAARSVADTDAPWLGPGSASAPRRMSDWTAYVRAVVQRYSGRIEAYQVWNEPADRIFWRGTDAKLATMTAVVKATVAEIDPSALVVAAPLVVRSRNWQSRAASYLTALADQNWPVDALAFHGYASGVTGPGSHSIAILQVREFLSRVQAPVLPLWETEVNFPEDSTSTTSVGAATERSWVARAYLDAARHGVDRVYWYAYADVPDFLEVDIRSSAVSPGFSSVSDWLTGATFVECTDDWQSLQDVTGCAFVDTRGEESVAIWSPTAQVVNPGRGRASDLRGATWSVDSALLVSTSPVWFVPSDRAS